MTKTEKIDFETSQNNFRVACEANQKLMTSHNEQVQRANALEKENLNLKQQVLNLTLERTALFQSLWDTQKLRKDRDVEIGKLKAQPQPINPTFGFVNMNLAVSDQVDAEFTDE